MRQIQKYVLNLSGDTSLYLPEGVVMLHVGLQHEVPMIWLAVPEVVVKRKEYKITGFLTGGAVPYTACYIGTVLIDNGNFVVHYFDMT